MKKNGYAVDTDDLTDIHKYMLSVRPAIPNEFGGFMFMDWLIQWYIDNCDGDWEHSFGIEIETVDNPGWSVEINITETAMDNVEFNTISEINREDSDDWIICKVEKNVFVGYGGPRNLNEILGIFKDWVEINEEK